MKVITHLDLIYSFLFFNNYYALYLRQVLYSLAAVNKGNMQVIIKKAHHSVERQ